MARRRPRICKANCFLFGSLWRTSPAHCFRLDYELVGYQLGEGTVTFKGLLNMRCDYVVRYLQSDFLFPGTCFCTDCYRRCTGDVGWNVQTATQRWSSACWSSNTTSTASSLSALPTVDSINTKRCMGEMAIGKCLVAARRAFCSCRLLHALRSKTYHWKSSICGAAYHAGAIGDKGGPVTMRIDPGMSNHVRSCGFAVAMFSSMLVPDLSRIATPRNQVHLNSRATTVHVHAAYFQTPPRGSSCTGRGMA